MTKARDLANIISGGFTADDIPNIDASKITTGTFDASKIGSGTFADARISQSSVSQHATSFDDNKIVNDISTLALRQASDANRSAYNTNSQFVDVFQDATGIDTTTNVGLSGDEYISPLSVTNIYETGNRFNTYTETKNFTYGGTDIRNALDGDFTVGFSTAFFFNEGTAQSTAKFFQYDLGAGNSKIYTGVKIYFESATTFGNWKIEGSNDASTYTELYPSFTLGGTGQGSSPYTPGNDLTWGNTTAYRYISCLLYTSPRPRDS